MRASVGGPIDDDAPEAVVVRAAARLPDDELVRRRLAALGEHVVVVAALTRARGALLAVPVRVALRGVAGRWVAGQHADGARAAAGAERRVRAGTYGSKFSRT